MRRASCVVALLGLLLPLAAMGLSSDRDQPINIEADKLEIDENRHISIYQGQVAMQQGSLQIHADRIVLHFDANNELQWLEIYGSPASFKQLNDQQQPISGSALKINYHQNESLMDMQGNAKFFSDKDSIESETISINTSTNALQAGDKSGDGRVRMLIQPRPATDKP